MVDITGTYKTRVGEKSFQGQVEVDGLELRVEGVGEMRRWEDQGRRTGSSRILRVEKHSCGLHGYDPGRGDVCDACSEHNAKYGLLDELYDLIFPQSLNNDHP